METPMKKGFGFGLTSGIITTLGLIVGLNSTTHTKSVVIGGVLIIAVADALSDAMGIHVSEEYSKKSHAGVWDATFSTFFSKFLFAFTFIVPVLLFQLQTAIYVSIAWGLSLITGFSYYLATQEKKDALPIIAEHLLITILVIFFTHFLGEWVSLVF